MSHRHYPTGTLDRSVIIGRLMTLELQTRLRRRESCTVATVKW
jgi:hypothetical protein